jgi:hypothetical protein
LENLKRKDYFGVLGINKIDLKEMEQNVWMQCILLRRQFKGSLVNFLIKLHVP